MRRRIRANSSTFVDGQTVKPLILEFLTRYIIREETSHDILEHRKMHVYLSKSQINVRRRLTWGLAFLDSYDVVKSTWDVSWRQFFSFRRQFQDLNFWDPPFPPSWFIHVRRRLTTNSHRPKISHFRISWDVFSRWFSPRGVQLSTPLREIWDGLPEISTRSKSRKNPRETSYMCTIFGSLESEKR